MNRLLCSVFLLLIILPAASDASEVSKVRLDKKEFSPSAGGKVTVSFESGSTSEAFVIIYDRLGREIRHIKSDKVDQGGFKALWNGKYSDGKQPEGNVFLYTIETATEDGKKAVYNPASSTGGSRMETLEYTFDKEKGLIEYILPKTSMVRIRTGLSSGMFAGTIFDWQPKTAGRHSLYWDGKDGSGLMNIANHPQLELNLSSYSLPANTIIFKGNIVPFKEDAEMVSTEENPWFVKDKYLHYSHDPRDCHDPSFRFSFPGSEKNENRVPVIFGRTPLRVILNEADTNYMINSRFEVMVFMDGIFLFEVEEGTSPFTCHLDTKGVKAGEHIITVNIMSYDDHVGSVSRKIITGAGS